MNPPRLSAWARSLAVPLGSVAAAFAVGALGILAVGDSPIETYRLLLGSVFSWPDGIGYTLFYATPLILTGLSVAIALRCGLLNIGAEGQLIAGAFFAAWVGIEGGGLPAIALVPLCIVAAAVGGGLWGAIPGVLRARFGAHEVITTIMLNFIAAALASWATEYFYKTPGDPILQTVEIAEGGRVARLGQFVPNFPERIPLSLAFFLALAACVGIAIFLRRTRWGFEIRATGANPLAAEYGGISTARQIVLAMTLAGAVAGLVGVAEVLGYRYRYYDGFSPGYGFTGIAVALLARGRPLGILFSALLFGALLRGGLFVDIFTEKVSKDLVTVLQAIIIVFVAIGIEIAARRRAAPPAAGERALEEVS